MIVWFAVGVVMVCVRAPPSDHLVKSYVLLPTVIGEIALITRWTPTTPVNVKGTVTGWPSSVRLAPDGLPASVTVTLRGCTSLNVVPDCPAESVTVRWTRYQTVDSV